MALQYVNLILDLFDGQGNYIQTGSASAVQNAQLVDRTDHEIIVQAPLSADFHTGGMSSPSISLLGTDSTGPLPTGWAWTISFNGVPGNPPPVTFFLNHSDGATQYLSDLDPVSDVPPMAAFLPIQYGNGAGTSKVWTSTDDDGTGAWEVVPDQPTGDNDQDILTPGYIYPTYFSAPGAWERWQAAASKMKYVIANVSSGPGSTVNADYAVQLPEAKAAGLLILGYVDTDFTATSEATVKGNIDLWYSLYPGLIDGIFFDEVTNDAGAHVTYYQDLYNYVQTKGGKGFVMINPGTVVVEDYMAVCDIVCEFEGDLGSYRGFAKPSWTINYPSRRFSHVVYACYSELQRDEALSLSRGYRAGHVFVTDDTLPNPYDTLPGTSGGGKTTPVGLTYWTNEIDHIFHTYPVTPWAPVIEDDFQLFDGAAFSPQWTVPGGSTAVIASLQAQLTCTASGNDALVSTSTFDFNGRIAEVQAKTVPSAASATTFLSLVVDANNSVSIGKDGTNLRMRVRSGGSNSDTTVAFDATNHKWWQISFYNGVLLFNTSPDGVSWKTQRTVTSSIPTLTAVTYQLTTVRTADSNQTVDFGDALCVEPTPASGDDYHSLQLPLYGEGSLPRVGLGTGAALATQRVQFTYFTAERTETVNSVSAVTGGTAAGATPTYCAMGFYGVNKDGSLTLLGACASDTTLFAAANTQYTRNVTTPFTKVKGKRYAFGALVVTAAALPNLAGYGGLIMGTTQPMLAAAVTGQSTLPSTVTAANQAGTSSMYFGYASPVVV